MIRSYAYTNIHTIILYYLHMLYIVRMEFESSLFIMMHDSSFINVIYTLSKCDACNCWSPLINAYDNTDTTLQGLCHRLPEMLLGLHSLHSNQQVCFFHHVPHCFDMGDRPRGLLCAGLRNQNKQLDRQISYSLSINLLTLCRDTERLTER